MMGEACVTGGMSGRIEEMLEVGYEVEGSETRQRLQNKLLEREREREREREKEKIHTFLPQCRVSYHTSILPSNHHSTTLNLLPVFREAMSTQAAEREE